MGKTTHYHPVSLNVIRAAAEYHGIVLTNIRQVTSSREHGTAVYNAKVRFMPASDHDVPSDGEFTPVDVWSTLQACFMHDIEVLSASWSSKNGWWVTLKTHLLTPQEQLAIADTIAEDGATEFQIEEYEKLEENDDRLSWLVPDECVMCGKTGMGEVRGNGKYYCSRCWMTWNS